MVAIALGQLGLERRTSSSLVQSVYHRVRPLEEVVDDLDLLGAGAEAGQRVDERCRR
jgi:hypothetical protein